MKHKYFKKRLIFFIEGNLPSGMQEEMNKHLLNCITCRNEMNNLRKIWESEIKPVKAPQAQWFKILNKIHSNKQTNKTSLPQYILIALRSCAYILVIFGVIFIGNIMGRGNSSKETKDNKKIQSYLFQEYALDHLDPIPPESLGHIFIFHDKNQKEVK